MVVSVSSKRHHFQRSLYEHKSSLSTSLHQELVTPDPIRTNVLLLCAQNGHPQTQIWRLNCTDCWDGGKEVWGFEQHQQLEKACVTIGGRYLCPCFPGDFPSERECQDS